MEFKIHGVKLNKTRYVESILGEQKTRSLQDGREIFIIRIILSYPRGTKDPLSSGGEGANNN